jgi:hypothetical protein
MLSKLFLKVVKGTACPATARKERARNWYQLNCHNFLVNLKFPGPEKCGKPVLSLRDIKIVM